MQEAGNDALHGKIYHIREADVDELIMAQDKLFRQKQRMPTREELSAILKRFDLSTNKPIYAREKRKLIALHGQEFFEGRTRRGRRPKIPIDQTETAGESSQPTEQRRDGGENASQEPQEVGTGDMQTRMEQESHALLQQGIEALAPWTGMLNSGDQSYNAIQGANPYEGAAVDSQAGNVMQQHPQYIQGQQTQFATMPGMINQFNENDQQINPQQFENLSTWDQQQLQMQQHIMGLNDQGLGSSVEHAVTAQQAAAGIAAAVANSGGRSIFSKGSNRSIKDRWTPEMDELLKEGREIYGKKWVKIAKHVGGGMDGKQCLNRWTYHVDPEVQNRKTGEWTQEEVDRLKELVAECQNDPSDRKKCLFSTNWTKVSAQLNRNYLDCKTKYKTITKRESGAHMKKGRFKPEEDAVILRRVQEWGNRGKGLWSMLEKELGRPCDSIRARIMKLMNPP